MNDKTDLLSNLFRTEFRRLVAIITKTFSLQQLEFAEDIVSETFLIASETWGKKGVPDNPSAWLYTVAKNKVKDSLKHNKVFTDKIIPEYSQGIFNDNFEEQSEYLLAESQLEMMYAVCSSTIPIESQIALALRILFGFSVQEIANALLTNNETINKRIYRAKENFKANNTQLSIPNNEVLKERTDAVLKVLYLLYNEGYYSTSQNKKLRKELCLEAMALTLIITENSLTNCVQANALLALMCFHTSRFESRTNPNDEIIDYDSQDKSKWNLDLVKRGEWFLNNSAKGDKISKYHLEAAIAYWHCQEESLVKWQSILQLYNQLLQLEYSPIAALNRTISFAKVHGCEKALTEALKLELNNNYLYNSLLGYLYKGTDIDKAVKYYEKSKKLAKSDSEINYIQKMINNLEKK